MRHESPGIGPILRDLRERKGLTQTYAAELLGIARITLSGWELGSIERPGHDALLRALDLYGATDEERGALASLIAFGVPADPSAAA